MPCTRINTTLQYIILFGLLAVPLSSAPGAIVSGAQRRAADGSERAAVEAAGVLSPEQTLRRYQMSDLQLAPDETRIAMSVVEPVKGTERKSNIWVLDVASKRVQRFTTGKSDTHPRWSPDGRTLAFVSTRDGSTQIFLVPVDGGEAEALTESKTAITAFEWSPDGSRIAYLSSDPKTDEEEKRLKQKDDAVVVDRGHKGPRLRVIQLESRAQQVLTKEDLRISEFVWLPAGDRLLVSATDHPRRDLYSNRLYVVSVEGKDPEGIETPRGPFNHLTPLPDGVTLAYLGARTEDDGSPHDLWLSALGGGNARDLTGSSIDRPIRSFRVRKDGRLVAVASTGFKSTLYHVTRNAEAAPMPSYPVDPSGSFVVGADLLAFVGETTTQAPEVWLSKGAAPPERVTRFNKEWDAIPLVPLEILRYPSFDGKDIEAALLRPPNVARGTRLPFVVLVHGGPAGLFADRFHTWSQLLAARGYAVLLPNIRGSLGYGHDFLVSNRFDWGGADWKDVMAGVDFAVKQGIADPERLGIGGWSYGGYMSAWAVTQTTRFKASVSGAPMTDLESEFGTESPSLNIGDTKALGTPYENPDLFSKRSPVTFVKNVKTPVLLLNGEEDTTDPIGQCEQFYRGLRRYNVETEFVRYPRMGHGPSEEKHQLDVLNRMLAWFDRYLKQPKASSGVS